MGYQETDLHCKEQCFNDFNQDLCWDNEELESLLMKEKQVYLSCNEFDKSRDEAVEWMFRVNAHFKFSVLTFVLAVNYFDRFCSLSVVWFKDKQQPWMSQLVAVSCLSLAAKVEEIQVPVLLNLQVEKCRYVFEAKTIQRMELLVLSTLRWRMNPVTPMSYFDHIVRRFGLRRSLHWEFMWICERILVSVVADPRFLRYLPSVIATAIMLHGIKELGPCSLDLCQNQIMKVLRTNEDEVFDCCKLLLDVFVTGKDGFSQNQNHTLKHPYYPGSPDRVTDALFSLDSSNDSWIVASIESYMPGPLFKRRKVENQQI